jgi:hypothetical protein
MQRSRLTIGITGAAVAVALSAGSAQATTMTFGDSLTVPYSDSFFSGDSGLINTRLISGASGASPVDGTVTGWAAADPQGTYSIQVVRPIAGGAYRALATGPSTALNFPLAPSPIQPASLPIQKGDFPVLNVTAGGHIGVSSAVDAGAGADDYFDPALATGGEGTLNSSDDPGQFIFNVTIRYCVVPDLKGRSLGAAKQALTAADCTFGKKIKPKIRKKKRKKLGVSPRIASQTVAPGTSISDTAPVDVTFGTKKKRARR